MINSIRIINDTIAHVRPKFTPGELSMLLDIFNATAIDPLTIQHGAGLDIQVRDSFDLYPGMYEEKWKVGKETFLAKIAGLSDWQAACIVIWACDFWASGIYEESDSINRYITGKAGISHRLAEALTHINTALGLQDKVKGAFRSKLVARARAETQAAKDLLTALIEH